MCSIYHTITLKPVFYITVKLLQLMLHWFLSVRLDLRMPARLLENPKLNAYEHPS